MFKNISYSILLNLLGVLTPLFTMPIVLRALGPEAYGAYAHAIVVSNWVVAVFIMSISAYCTRSLINSKESNLEVVVFSGLFSFQVILSMLALLVHFIVVIFLNPQEDLKLYAIFFISTGLSFLNVDWYFYVKEKLNIVFWRTFFIRICTIGLLFYYVRSKSDLQMYAIIMCLSSVFSNLIGFLLAAKGKKILFNPQVIVRFKEARYFFSSSSIGSIYQFADQFLVGIFATKTDVAYLSLCKQLMAVAMVIPSSICRYMLVKSTSAVILNDYKVYLTKFFKNYMYLCFFLLFGFCTLTGLVVDFVTLGKFEISNWIYILCGITCLITSVAVFIDTQISIPLHRELITTKSNIIVAISSLLALATLIPLLGYVGAIWGLLAGELLGVLCMYRLHGYFKKL